MKFGKSVRSFLFVGAMFAAAMLSALSNVAYAQEVMKHPRVVELEDRLNKDAAAYIKSRFPDVPFMVVVRVDPLRREGQVGSSAQESQGLPYFESFEDDEEIRDEWDNHQIPLMALLNRVRKISVQISVPSKLKTAEVDEMRDGIFSVLHLTPARDQIEVSRREWTLEEVPWLSVYVLSGAMLALLIGLLVINRTSANRIARALTEMKVQNGGGGQSAASLPPMPSEREFDSSRKTGSQEVKFNDPIKMKELASGIVSYLSNSGAFPTHHDVFVLDSLGKRSPSKLGALLMEFSSEVQASLFSYSAGQHWIEALNEPGFLDFECIETLQSISQHARDIKSIRVKNSVLAVWRLGDERAKFLRTLQRDEAFYLLSEMPKSIAVSEARKAFPGAWGAILDVNFKAKEVSEKRLEEIRNYAVMIDSLRDMQLVKRYRAEKELLEYVKFVDPNEEREIYEAASSTSLIHQMRPPFYSVFLQNDEVLGKLVPTIAVDTWALALFNVLKTERTIIDKHLSEKQRFLMIERFKRFDQQPPGPGAIAHARESVAVKLKTLIKELEVAKTVAGTGEDAEGVSQNEAA